MPSPPVTADVADAGAPTAGRLTGSADVTAPVGKDDAGMLLVGSAGRPVVGDTGNAPAAASAVAGTPVTVLALGSPPLPPGKADVTGANAAVAVEALGNPPPVGKPGTPPPVGRPGLLTVMAPPVFELRLAALELVVSVSGPWLIVWLRAGALLVTGRRALPAVATTPLTCEGGGGVPTLVPAAETVTPLGEAETSKGTLADPPLARLVT